jgi:hypothetical protein
MIDFEPFEQLSSSAQLGYFMGASRARQLLAVVHEQSHPISADARCER